MPADPKPVAVFLGPSLERAAAEEILEADYYPPVQLGDVYRMLSWGVRTIVVIDGVFHTGPSVWQRELLAALHEGIAVIGASSMGALRAAELEPFGMVGVGQVFEWYRDGVLDEDDAVALRHGPEELGYRALSEPLVNIMASLDRAVRAEIIDASEQRLLLEHCRGLAYPERSVSELLSFAERQSTNLLRRLDRFLATGRVDIKQLDAVQALELARDIDAPAPFEGVPSIWDAFRVLRSAVNSSRGWVMAGGLLDFLRRTNVERWQAARRRARRAFFVGAWLAAAELEVPRDLELEPPLAPDETLRDWLYANGLTERRYRLLAERRALCDWAVANVDQLLPETASELDAESRLLLQWADHHGVSTSSAAPGSLELAEWLTERGPRFFGFSWEDEPEAWELLQLDGEAAALVQAFLDEVGA